MSVLAFDIGASSGRAVVGDIVDERIVFSEVYRFNNDPVNVCGNLYWDILRLLHEVKEGIRIAARSHSVEKIGIDTWGVDFGIIGHDGTLLSNPRHYRDARNLNTVCNDAAYDISGIQFLGINTMYQLKKTDLSHAHRLLLIPDLLCYFLTGEMHTEYTNASTTNMLDARTHEFSDALLSYAGVTRSMFPDMIKPGEVYGYLTDEVCKETGCKRIPVVAVGSHDTASAVASVPYEDNESFAYISSGTWSLFGTLSDVPVISDASRTDNFTNELGIDFSTRLLKNISGLFMIQEIRREVGTSFSELTELAAAAAPFAYYIDPDDPRFSCIGSMTDRIISTLNIGTLSTGALVRCVYESLAMKYRKTLLALSRITDKEYDKLYIVGGGVKDKLLCSFTASACGIPVVTAASEATALGNLAVLLTSDIRNVRKCVKRSVNTTTYLPTETDDWQREYERFLEVTR